MDLTWFQDTPVPLFVDTSSLVSENFDFTSKKMGTVKGAIKLGDLSLIVTSIFKSEFIKHSRTQLDGELKAFERFGMLKNLSLSKYQDCLDDFQKFDELLFWQQFCEEFHATDISTDIDWRIVFDDYFNHRPPFSEKKPKEFPDAFNIKMIEKLNPKKLIVVAADPDFDLWSSGRKNVQLFKSLLEFTNHYTRLKDPAFIGKADAALSSAIREIERELRETFSETDHYSIDSFHSEITSSEIESITLKKKFVTAVSKEQAFAGYRLVFKGTSKLEISSAVVVYDSVDKEDNTLGYNNNNVEVDFSANVDVTLVNLESDDFEYVIDDVSFEASEVEVPHEWESFVDE